MTLARRDRIDEAALSSEVVALLERRAALLRAPVATDEVEDLAWLAELDVGHATYAFRLEQLRGAMPLRLVTPVPLAPAHIVGIFSYQGRILCVHSLAALLGVRGWRVDPAVVVVLEPEPGTLFAFDCEAVPRAVTIPSAAIRQALSRSSGPVVALERESVGALHFVDDVLGLLGGARAG